MLKKMFVMLLVAFPLYAQQTNTMTTGSLIFDTRWDSTFVKGTAAGVNLRVYRSSVAKDTVKTMWVHVENVNADLSIEFKKTNVSGTDTAQVYFEAFRGYGTPDSFGVSKHLLVTTNFDTLMTFYPPDSSWVSKRLFSRYRIAVYERAAQQNDYIININQYSPSGRNAVITDPGRRD